MAIIIVNYCYCNVFWYTNNSISTNECCTRMGLYGIIWDYMGLYGIIWLYPLVNCYITMEITMFHR